MPDRSFASRIRRRKRRFVVGAAIGTGMAANFAIRGGADFLIALNAGRLRSMGEPSVASMLALNEANAFVMDFASREILPRSTVPVVFGACAFDPRQDLGALVEKVRAAGFDGITNFPTASLIGGSLRRILEGAGLGHAREREMLRLARAAGLATVAYTHTLPEAEAVVDIGVDIVVCGLGWNQGGALGHSAERNAMAIEDAAIHVDRAARAAGAAGALCLVEGGPIISPRHLEELCRFVNIDGYVGGSTIDRVPLETAIEEVTASFKTIGRAGVDGPANAAGTAFPMQLVGRSDLIQVARRSLVTLAAGDGPVHLSVPDPAGAGVVAETFHSLSPQNRRDPIVVTLGPESAEARRADLFGSMEKRQKIGWLELASDQTLVLNCARGTPADLVRDVAEAVRRGRARPIGGGRAYPIRVRLVVASGQDLSPVPGLAYLALPRLADRSEDVSSVLDQVLNSLRFRLRRPLLRLDAAAWRMLVDHTWPGDIDELRQAVEAAALVAQNDVITPVELGDLRDAALGRALFASEKDWILDGLRRNSFHRGRTADWLGISRKTLYNKVRRYALDLDSAG